VDKAPLSRMSKLNEDRKQEWLTKARPTASPLLPSDVSFLAIKHSAFFQLISKSRDERVNQKRPHTSSGVATTASGSFS
jgi:hypothetical protein